MRLGSGRRLGGLTGSVSTTPHGSNWCASMRSMLVVVLQVSDRSFKVLRGICWRVQSGCARLAAAVCCRKVRG